METTLKTFGLLCATLALAACQTSAGRGTSTASEGRAFAQETCGRCHAVGLYGGSPNPNARTFLAIVNHEGLTGDTLSTWLRGAHNYPREMDFYLTERQVEGLVGYMLTLKDPNYVRPAD